MSTKAKSVEKRDFRKLKLRLAAEAKNKTDRLHVIARPQGWVVKKEGDKEAISKIIRTQAEAIEEARKMMKTGKASKVVVHTKTGRISK